MKKHLLLINSIFVCLTGTIMAQPTLTAAGLNPVVGDVQAITTTNYVSPGTAGASQTWNLSSATTSGSQSYNVVTPSSTPNSATFANATVCLSGGGSYLYSVTSSSAWQNRGIVTPSAVVINYTNNEDWLHYPFNYNNSYTDPWAANFVNGGYTYYRSGTTAVTADGYGTLVLPNGTFNNVMRVHFHQIYKDSVDLGGTPYIINYDNDEYMWYLNGNHYPVATMYTLVSDFGTQTGGSYLSNTVGIKENADNSNLFSVFPSPAASELTVQTTGITTVERIEIISITGATVLAVNPFNALSSADTYKLNLSTLTSGVYFVQLTSGEGIVSRKKVVITK